MEDSPSTCLKRQNSAIVLPATDDQRSEGQPSSKLALIGFLFSLASPCLLLLGLCLMFFATPDVVITFGMVSALSAPAWALIGLVVSFSALFFERLRGVSAPWRSLVLCSPSLR